MYLLNSFNLWNTVFFFLVDHGFGTLCVVPDVPVFTNPFSAVYPVWILLFYGNKRGQRRASVSGGQLLQQCGPVSASLNRALVVRAAVSISSVSEPFCRDDRRTSVACRWRVWRHNVSLLSDSFRRERWWKKALERTGHCQKVKASHRPGVWFRVAKRSSNCPNPFQMYRCGFFWSCLLLSDCFRRCRREDVLTSNCNVSL